MQGSTIPLVIPFSVFNLNYISTSLQYFLVSNVYPDLGVPFVFLIRHKRSQMFGPLMNTTARIE